MFDTEIYHRIRRALYRLEPVAQLLQIDDETQTRQTLFIDSGVGFVIIFVVIVVVIVVIVVVVVRRCRFRRFRSYDGLRCRQHDRLMDGVVGDEFEYDRRDGDRALTIRGSIERHTVRTESYRQSTCNVEQLSRNLFDDTVHRTLRRHVVMLPQHPMQSRLFRLGRIRVQQRTEVKVAKIDGDARNVQQRSRRERQRRQGILHVQLIAEIVRNSFFCDYVYVSLASGDHVVSVLD
jgi:hypothetical protein